MPAEELIPTEAEQSVTSDSSVPAPSPELHALLVEWAQPRTSGELHPALLPDIAAHHSHRLSIDAPETGAKLHAAFHSLDGVAALGAHEIGRGAFARIYGFAGSLQLADTVFKVGTWQSAAAFDREVQLQARAADAGCGPRVHNAFCAPSFAKAVHGMIAMERLSGPTFTRWLYWLTRDARRERGVPDEANPWRIDVSKLGLPIVIQWRAASHRLEKELFAAGVTHGDWHDRNLVFDVPAVREQRAAFAAASPEDGGHKAMKRAMIDAIAAGPEAGRARLLAIDYGCAHELSTQLARTCAPFCAAHRLADIYEEAASPITPRLAVAAAIKEAESARPAMRRAEPRKTSRPAVLRLLHGGLNGLGRRN